MRYLFPFFVLPFSVLSVSFLVISSFSLEICVVSADYFRKAMERSPIDISQKLEYFLATGNLRSQTIESMQV
jgi:hypothetical protein